MIQRWVRKGGVAWRCFIACLACTAIASSAANPDQLTNRIGMRLVRVQPGSFRMGFGDKPVPIEIAVKNWREKGDFDEHPAHRVTLTEPFYMGAYEVTNAEYEKFDPAHRE